MRLPADVQVVYLEGILVFIAYVVHPFGQEIILLIMSNTKNSKLFQLEREVEDHVTLSDQPATGKTCRAPAGVHHHQLWFSLLHFGR
jgi:hypothetical protein